MDGRFLIGYARVSTEDQDLRLQVQAMERYGVPPGRIIKEKMSGKSLRGRKLNTALKYLRPGDRIVVWKLDRLARSVKDMIRVVETIEKAGADLVSLTEGVDTSTAMGRFFFHIIASIAELERGMISERTKAGMAARKAKDPDVKWGAKHWFDDFPKRRKHVQGLYNAGEFTLQPNGKGGVKIKGMSALALMAEINAPGVIGDALPVKNAETIRRWLRAGAPGLDYTLDAGEAGDV
ncbi:recombinase family protein [Yoonia sp. R2331]|uniref:recombinase family protein n=1 Tax=Yoonia sp. R2331 TaxID=3237238 RepID=UPI0034E438CA